MYWHGRGFVGIQGPGIVLDDDLFITRPDFADRLPTRRFLSSTMSCNASPIDAIRRGEGALQPKVNSSPSLVASRMIPLFGTALCPLPYLVFAFNAAGLSVYRIAATFLEELTRWG
jgi:hypothetical protein